MRQKEKKFLIDSTERENESHHFSIPKGVSIKDFKMFYAAMIEYFEKNHKSVSKEIGDVNKNVNKTFSRIVSVEKQIETKEITSQGIKSLDLAIENRALYWQQKIGSIQITMDMVNQGKYESMKSLDTARNNQLGRIKSQILVDVNKICLERRGNASKKTIKNIHVERCLAFINKWEPK